ncbi:inverse autotransporter beta domain-containing protein, partial [Salmonella enterica]
MLTVWVVWLNIAMQILFPLAGVFTPVIAHAQRQSLETGRTTSRTQVYTLGKGESVQSVARKYNLTIAELRELNQLRTFAHGFSALKVGDELDVPYKSDVKASLNNNKKSPQNTIDSGEQKVAQVASQAGSFLANSPDSNAAAGMARGMAAGAASSSVQQWLSQFGTARIQLDADDNFSLKNSQLDMLVPLWERKDKLVFTQGSIHRTDERMQSNLGLGMRYFGSDYMIGGNTFLDYDLSRSHARSGLGVEYGRDYLKLAANGYLRLTGWKDSDDVEDYEERPANGWDIRAEGWLPAIPQLGGKLTYEQYYGDEVALFGKDNRQQDPHAITVGLNYTPVPLLTLRAEQRQGQDGKSDTRFGLEMNYQLGVPWVHQIDPESVAALRSLDGARYALVERNNNIVLEYRKKEVIHLKTADLITGYAGEQRSLGVSVESKHGVRQIDWSAPALLAAGGRIVGSGMDYSVVLPAYQYGDAAVNTYMVTATAVDQKGNRSDQSETQVTVNASEISAAYSTFKPRSGTSASSDLTLPADGTSTGVLVLILQDNQQQPVDVSVDELKLAIEPGPLPQPRLRAVKGETVQKAKVSDFIRKSSGEYEVTVTAGTRDELLTLTPSVSNIQLSAAKVLIRKNTPDAGQSTFGVSPKTIAADNTTTSILTLTAKDADGNALTGVATSLNFAVTDSDGHVPAAGKVTVSSITETVTAGVYTATLQGILAGTYMVKPQFSGSIIGNLSDTVTLTAGTTPDVNQSVFVASPRAIEADNEEISTLTLTVKDSFGNVITGIGSSLRVDITDSNGNHPPESSAIVSSVSESATPGVYTATLKGTHADTYTVRPQFNGSNIGSLNDTVILMASVIPDGSQSAFDISPKIIAADDVTTSTLTLTAKDRFGNNIPGLASALSVIVTDSGGHVPEVGKVMVSSLTETATPGVYVAILKGNLAGTWTVKPQMNGSAIGSLSDSVTLTSGSTPDGSQSAFAASPKSIVADDVTTSLLTFTAKDTFGNAITGIAGNISFAVSDSGGSAPAAGKITVSSVMETATAGVYTATLKGQLADTWTVKPQVNGSAIGSLSDSVTLTSGGTPDGTQSSFAASPKSIVADDIATSLLTFTAKDPFGNAIAGIMADKLSFTVTGSGGSAPEVGKVTVSGVTETATTGVYTATLKGQLADTYIIKPQFSSSNVGNLSDTVTLTSGSTPDGTQSKFVASPKSIAADDSQTSTLTLTAKDKFGNTLVGLAGSLNFAVTGSGGSAPVAGKVTVSSITETATPGVYTATLKGQQADIWTVKPQMNGSAIGSLSDTVELTAGTAPDAAHSLFAASPSSVTADDLETSTLKLVAKDSFGNLIPGIAGNVSFLVTPAADGKITVSNVSETTRGNYTATLRGTRAGTYTVVPQISGTTLGSLTDTVVLKSGTVPDVGQSVFEVSPASIVADGVQSSNLLLTVKDVNGNNITGLAGSLSLAVTDNQSGLPAGAAITVSSLAETAAPGIYRATLKGTLAGTWKVVPKYAGTAMGSLSGIVSLTAGAADAGQSVFAASPKSIVADDTATSTLTLTVNDAQGNTVTGIVDSLSFAVTDSGGSTPAGGKVTVSSITETATPGTYTAILKGQLAGVWTVKPQVNGSVLGSLSDIVTLTAGSTPDETHSSFTATPDSVAADDTATSTLILSVRDAFGNAIGGIVDNLSVTVTGSGGSVPAAGKVTVSSLSETATPGTYTATLKGTQAGLWTITPKFNGSAIGGLSDTVTLTAGTT